MRLRQFQVLLFTLVLSFVAENSFAVTWTSESLISSGDYRDVAVGDMNKDGHIDAVAAKDGGISIKHQAKSWVYGANGLVGDWQYSFRSYVSAPYPDRDGDGIPDSNDTVKNTGNGVIAWSNSIPPASTSTEVWKITCTTGSVDAAVFDVKTYNPATGALLRDFGSATADFTLAATNNITGGSTISYSSIFSDITSGVSFIVSSLTTTNSNYLQFAVGDTFTFYTIASETTLTSTGGNVYNAVQIADVNLDGNPDVLAVSDSGADVWFGDGRGGWAQKLTNALTSGKGIKVGDFNRDGDVDVAIATTAGIKVYTGDGTGLLAGWTAYSTNLQPDTAADTYNSLAVGDYNNDGLQDVIAVNGTDKKIYVYKNNGNGSWTSVATGIAALAAGTYRTVVVADLDNDGKLDLAAGIEASAGEPAGIKVYYGNGAGGWTASSLNPTGFDNYYGISIADLNNDGSLDIAGAQNGGGVQVWFGDKSTKTWVPQTSPTVVGGYKAIVSGDILNNGIRNLIGAKNGGVEVFSPESSPLFNSWLTGPTAGGSYQRTETLDIDKDGKLDIVATDNAVGESLGGVHVFYGDGTTRLFAQNVKYPSASDPASSGTYYGLALGDISRDGYPDIVATSNGVPGGINIWNYISASNSWIVGTTTGLPTSGNYYGVRLADLNGDAYLDIVAGSDSGVKVYQWNSGTSQYDGKSPLYTGSYFDIVLTDLNRDGMLDIVAVKSGGISLWLNDGDFTGDDEAKNSLNVPVVTDYTGILSGTCWIGVSSGANYAGISAGDLDNDGNMDIVAGNSGGCGVQTWFGDGSGKTWRIGYSTEPGPNKDNTGNGGFGFGYPSGNSSVHSNLWPVETGRAFSVTNDWTLTAGIITTESPSFAFAVIGETNRAAVGSPYESGTEIGNLVIVPGSSTFHPIDTDDKTPADKFFFRTSAPGIKNDSGSYYSIDIADINHDGLPDVIAASNGEGVSVWFGNGRGGWEQKASPVTAGDYNGVRLADFNGDGYLDVVAGHHISGGVGLEVFLNNIDLVPPKVSSTTPANNGSNIAVSDSITVQFSEAIDRTTLNGTNVTVSGSSSGSRTVNISYNGTLTIDPTLDFFPKEEITVTLTTGVTDVFGNGLDGNGNGYADGSPTDDYTFKFQTKDTAPAGLQATAGTGQAQLNWDNNRENNFKGYFVYRATTSGGCANYIGSLTQGGTCVKLTASPITAINYTDSTVINDTTYYYVVLALDEVPGYTTDIYAGTGNGNYVSGPSNEVSATPTVSKPTVTNIDPGNAATDIAKNKVIDITFSRDMDATVLPAQFSVVGSSKGVYTITVAKLDTKTVRLSHAAIFDSLETITVTVKSEANGGLKDTSGTPVGLAEDYVITFTSEYINIAKTIMVSATPTTVPGDGVSIIDVSAIVQDSNGYTVQAGATVTFTTGSGKFSNNTQTIEALTDASGKATAKITAPAAFQENVTVTAGTVSDLYGTLSASTLVNFKPGPPSSITLSASPASIPADAVSTTTITADIKDSGGNAVKDGLYVTLTTTLGKFANGTTTSDPVATSGGKATAVITAGAVTGASTITATVGGTTASSAAVLTLTAKPVTITVSASPTTIAADGTTTTTITATAKDSGGTNIGNGVVINFSTTAGTLSASSAAIAGGTGQASVTLTAPAARGSATVTSTWTNGTDSATGSTTVDFKPGPSDSIAVTSANSIITPTTGSTTITVVVKDSGGDFVKTGTTVNFTTTLGTVTASSTTNASGVATATLTAGATKGTATVTATVVDSGAKSGTVSVIINRLPAEILLSATTVYSGGQGTTTITANVNDINGNPVADGITVNFTASAGSLSADTATTSGGKASVTIASFGSFTTTINADCEGIPGSINVYIVGAQGLPQTITVSADPVNIPVKVNADDWGSYTKITVLLKDEFDNNVSENTPVTIWTAAGALFDKVQSPVPLVYTDQLTLYTKNSTVEAYLYSHDIHTRTSNVLVLATSYTVSGYTYVNFRPGPPEDITFSASPMDIKSDGISTSNIKVKVRDAIAGGRSTALAATVLTDNTRSWTVDAFKGMKLNPNTTQGTTYTIASNTATTITVTVGDMTTVAAAGKTYKVSATGTSTGVATTVLTDTTANWTTNALVGLNLNPNMSQGQVFEITGNDATTITVKTNGLNTVAVAGNTYEIAGDNVKDGLLVTFKTDKGTFLNGTQISDTTTTIGGMATVAIKSSTTSGDVPVITAILGRLEQDAKPVTFSSTGESKGVPAQLTVSSSATSVAADGTSSTTITATVSDQYGYPVADGLTVAFTTTAGRLSAATGTTSGGKATAIITATTTLTNSVTVTATCEGVSNTTTIAFKPGPPATIEMSSSPSTISANGIDTSTITAILKDSGGNLVKDGLFVTLRSDIGAFPNKTQVSDPIATSVGKVTVVLTADTNKSADRTATITAQIGLLSASYSGLTLKMDNIRPTIVTPSPASGNSGVLVNTGIAAVFSEEIDQATLTTTTFTVSGSLSGAVAGSVSYNSSSKTASFTPSVNFMDLEVVTVTLTTGVTDLAGNALASNYAWTFTTRDSVPPAVPTGLSAVAGNAQVALSWSANAEADFKGYNVYRTETSGSGYALVTTGGTVSVTTYTDTGVTNGKTYYYAITAVDTSGNESSKSSEVVSNPSNVNPPAPPKGVAATVAGTTSINLTWTANTESNLTGYKVYQSTTSGSLYALVATLGKVTSQQVTGLTAGTTYYYVITATDSNGYESSYSTEVTARPGLTGDVDGVLVGGKLTVDGSDLIAFAAAFGSSKGDVSYNQYADLNGDGTVSGKDLGILGRNFGRTN